MRGLFVTATDTGVGKTILCASLLAAISSEGENVRAFKPAITGLNDEAEIAARGAWPPDHELLATLAGMDPMEVAPLRYGPAVSPHLAAQLAGEPIDPRRLLAHARGLLGTDEEPTLIVEGVGGLLVPLTEDYCIRDLANELALALLIAARPGLGTINHTLLSLRSAREAGLHVAAVVLTPWPAQPDAIALSNRETIAHIGEVDVHTLEPIRGPDRAQLAHAGARLPWREWLTSVSA